MLRLPFTFTSEVADNSGHDYFEHTVTSVPNGAH